MTMLTNRFLSTIVLCVISLGGCSSLAPTKLGTTVSSSTNETLRQTTEQTYWWHIRFRLHRDADGEAQTFIDPLLADQLISPVLHRFADKIPLWRFHRRWGRDSTGHQFSFIFYTTPDIAKQIRTEVDAHPVLAELRSAGLLRQVVSDQAPSEKRAALEGTSDPAWSEEIQREWPEFIMGASRTWLGLIKAEAAKRQNELLLERYLGVEDALADIWFKEANHAFFHHLSALFGYRPMRVIRRDVMTF